MRTLTIDQFLAELHAQGVAHKHFAFRCPACGTIQSAASLIAATAGATFQEVEKFLGFSCVGRFTGIGSHQKHVPAGFGCDWTLGGLFQIHHLEVVDAAGMRHPRFEIASPEEARALLATPFDPSRRPPAPPPVPASKLRSKRRYQEWLSADCNMRFGEWLKYKARQHRLGLAG